MLFIFVKLIMTDTIQPSDLIDVSDNKPLDEETKEPELTNVQETQSESPKQILSKKIKDLTNEERSIIINNAKNGIDNEFYKVQFYKNGSSRITKRKAPRESTSEKLIKNHSPSLTTEQLLMEHVIGLESQIATMRQKQKRLKNNYRQLYQDIYVEDEDLANDSQSNITNNITAITNDLSPNIPNNQPQEELQQQSPSISQQNTAMPFPIIKRRGWRARIPLYY